VIDEVVVLAVAVTIQFVQWSSNAAEMSGSA